MLVKNKTLIKTLLLGLTALDAFYTVLIIVSPESWYKFMHDAPYVDPQGLLRRTAGVWAAFALFHLVTYFKWEKQPLWLAVSAGIRLSEIFADWTYLYFAQDMTAMGKISLSMAGLTSIALGWYFFKSAMALTKNASA